jgi:PAS domain S-box-containing protein
MSEELSTPQSFDWVDMAATPLHVVCSVRGDRDRELLVDWLGSVEGITVSTATADELVTAPFDLCIIDQSTLKAVGDQLLERSQQAQPIALPCLLITTGRPTTTSAVGESTTDPDTYQPLVTDVISAPVRKAQLRRRLSTSLKMRQQSKQLASSNTHHRELLELLPEAVLVVSEGTIQYVNTAAECLFDASESTLLGSQFLDYIAAADRSTATELLTIPEQSETVSGTNAEFVDLELAVDGRAIQIEAASTAVGLTGDAVQLICRDMTERNEREDQLRLYRKAMDEATVGITITDARQADNPLVYVNREFERLTGLDSVDVLGRNPRFPQSPRTDPDTVAGIRRAVENGESISVELLNQSSDGTEWHNALDISPVHQDGELTHFLGFQRDITDTHAQQNQLAVLDRVLRHNLRNRLNVVLGHAEALADGASTDAIPIHAGTICKTAGELLDLSDKTRRFRAAIEADTDSAVTADLVPILQDSLTTVAEEYPSAVFEHTIPERAQIQSKEAVRFALTELLSNAVDHSDQQTPQVSLSVSETENELWIQIVDDGPGIPAAERQAFTDTTETPTDHAIGIGLWLVRWAVDSTGGELEYEDAEPRGSHITIRLPSVDAPE